MHPLAHRAAMELMATLQSHDAAHWRLHEAGNGKMFGVLVVAAGDGTIGYLRGFSGMVHGKWDIDGWAPPTFDRHAYGAVSEETVRAMAEGARSRFAADIAVAVSGIAGPDGGTADKPVGTVHFAWAEPGGVTAARRIFAGSRETVRRLTVALALERLNELVAAG